MSRSRKVETVAEAIARLDRELSDLRAFLATGAPLSGSHSSLSGVLPDQHHARSHAVDSTSDHTASGLTAGHVLLATGASTFAWGQLAHSSLSGATSSPHVTNGDSHDHAGGDGAQINHAGLANLTTGDPHTQYALLAGAIFTGQVRVPAGTSTAPGLEIGENDNAGVYLQAAGRPFLVASGELGSYRRTSTESHYCHAFASDVGGAFSTVAAVFASGAFHGNRRGTANEPAFLSGVNGDTTDPAFKLPTGRGVYDTGSALGLVGPAGINAPATTSSTTTWRADSSGTFRNLMVPSSRAAVKRDREPVDPLHALALVRRLGVERFRWIARVRHDRHSPLRRGAKDWGLIADDVAEVEPLWAEYDARGPADVSDRRVLAGVIAAVQAIAAGLDDLAARVNELEV